jgi:chromosome partitioning protein
LATRRIIVLNQKGGVGKTTTVANLGACLAELGKTVLLVDVDPQANLSIHFGIEVERGEPSLYTLLRGEHDLRQVVRRTPVHRMGWPASPSSSPIRPTGSSSSARCWIRCPAASTTS